MSAFFRLSEKVSVVTISLKSVCRTPDETLELSFSNLAGIVPCGVAFLGFNILFLYQYLIFQHVERRNDV